MRLLIAAQSGGEEIRGLLHLLGVTGNLPVERRWPWSACSSVAVTRPIAPEAPVIRQTLPRRDGNTSTAVSERAAPARPSTVPGA